MVDPVDDADARLEPDPAALQPARFRVEIDLPDAEPPACRDAAAAVHQEYRDSARWKRLTATKVTVLAERDRGVLFVVHLDKAVEFDWTWEGATAFCPRWLDQDPRFQNHTYEEADYEDDDLWSGEIVEVDLQKGYLFIALDNPEAPPRTGPFFVRPFEFLSVLDDVYNAPAFHEARRWLAPRLTASAGGVHPRLRKPAGAGLMELNPWWQYAWSLLWGPPGTGKTWTTGQQIARILDDPRERVLVVSTTNRATDAVALALGEAAKQHAPEQLHRETLLRIGKGAAHPAFAERGLESMLAGTESDVLAEIGRLARQLNTSDDREENALTRNQIKRLRARGNDQSKTIFLNPEKRVVVATAFKAMTSLRDMTIRKQIEQGEAPFTTLFIDEAGLISRAAVAALSLLAARRVVLVGDSKQLAPISRISRVLPSRQQTWLASSGLSHLDTTDDIPPAVHLLSEQHRMHPDICKVVSNYQYDGRLTTSPNRIEQPDALPACLAAASRAIWYVLDEEDSRLTSIRAARGPGNRSWVRKITPRVLGKLLGDNETRQANGLFITPFKAQAQAATEWLTGWKADSWEASTVHSQQGSEADIVVFDSVNAGSHTWSIPEWKRLVNVALSRAREAIIVLASRAEMDEPYLRSLRDLLSPRTLRRSGTRLLWHAVPGANRPQPAAAETAASYRATSPARPGNRGKTPSSPLGDQVAGRKAMTPLLSQEQQRLTNLELDGKPRLIRGVAGSGKSVVLCNWLAKTACRLCNDPAARIWAVYANRSLHHLLQQSIESAWRQLLADQPLLAADFPWRSVELLHVRDILAGLLPSVNLDIQTFGFDYDRAAAAFLQHEDADQLVPRCNALFIDEAQDMGPSTLRLLLSVVEQSDPADTNSRAANIFYDNAQNVYDTKTPTWSSFGLDLRGRSTIMRESFRATRPITELATNVLQRLCDGERQDQKELMKMGILSATTRDGRPWLEAHFSQVDGPRPIFHRYASRSQEMQAIARHLKHLVEVDHLPPTDICILYNGGARRVLAEQLAPLLADFDVELSFQKNGNFQRQSKTLLATTPHSYKGYESEVVLIPCVDHYVAPEGKLLASGLYVAMTRARSLLAIYGIDGHGEASRRIIATLRECSELQRFTPDIEATTGAE